MREPSLDLLRGLVMLIMIIDHTQEYQAGPGRGVMTDPMTLAVTPWSVYVLRVLSHFCAPVFTLLMGISAYLSASRKPAGEAARHLFARGLVLLALEFTVVNWAWTFNPLWHRYFFQVIGALGVAMVCLAAVAQWPRRAAGAAGVALLAGHNLFDAVRFEAGTAAHSLWSFLHQKNVLEVGGGFELRTTYPVIPVVGLALCGWAMGDWWSRKDAPMVRVGLWVTAVFLVLRVTNAYGDPSAFVMGEDGFRSFFNVTKYPMSLQYVCMTAGPALVFLGVGRGWRWGVVEQFGRTAMFFYISHLVLLHGAALGAAAAMGKPLDFAGKYGGVPDGVGFPVWATAPLGLLAAAVLYPLCRWYEPRRWKYI